MFVFDGTTKVEFVSYRVVAGSVHRYLGFFPGRSVITSDRVQVHSAVLVVEIQRQIAHVAPEHVVVEAQTKISRNHWTDQPARLEIVP